MLLEESTRRDGLELPRPFDQSIAKSKTSLLKRVSGPTTIIAPSLSASGANKRIRDVRHVPKRKFKRTPCFSALVLFPGFGGCGDDTLSISMIQVVVNFNVSESTNAPEDHE